MPKWLPVKRRIFIKKLKSLGFEGPVSGSKHKFMLFKNHRMAIPSNREYSIPQVRFLISEIEVIIDRKIPLEEWNEL